MFETQPSGPVVVRPARPGDVDRPAELLAELSPASSFHRFLTGVRPPGPALVRELLRDDREHGALLAVGAGSARGTALGHACWSLTPAGPIDVGVVVADGMQGQGLGAALFLASVDAARAAGGSSVHLDVHPENRRPVAALPPRL